MVTLKYTPFTEKVLHAPPPQPPPPQCSQRLLMHYINPHSQITQSHRNSTTGDPNKTCATAHNASQSDLSQP